MGVRGRAPTFLSATPRDTPVSATRHRCHAGYTDGEIEGGGSEADEDGRSEGDAIPAAIFEDEASDPGADEAADLVADEAHVEQRAEIADALEARNHAIDQRHSPELGETLGDGERNCRG